MRSISALADGLSEAITPVGRSAPLIIRREPLSAKFRYVQIDHKLTAGPTRRPKHSVESVEVLSRTQNHHRALRLLAYADEPILKIRIRDEQGCVIDAGGADMRVFHEKSVHTRRWVSQKVLEQ